MVECDDKDLIDYARSFISHGRMYGGDFTKFDKNKWQDRFLFSSVGSLYRADCLSAALGNSQFTRVLDIILKRKTNALALTKRLSVSGVVEHFIFPDYKYIDNCVFQFYPIKIKRSSFVQREQFLQYLYENKIDSRVLLSLTNQPAIKKLYGGIEDNYPFSKECNKYGFIIGCHQGLNVEDMEYIGDIFEKYIRERE